jgi:alpha-beta hydrolase superfamily lysophospholipase
VPQESSAGRETHAASCLSFRARKILQAESLFFTELNQGATPVLWLWIGLGLLLAGLLLFGVHLFLMHFYLPHIVRIFQEKPLFIIPFGQPDATAQEMRFPTSNGLTLCGCYFPAPGPRKGVIVFGLEFGSKRWSCVPYCSFLREQGYDIFTFEMRNQGESDSQPGYEPLQWVTEFEIEDFRAALAYLKSRPDADPRGVGLFGISKGANAGLMVAAGDSSIRCAVTDGAFAAVTTMVPYEKKWFAIYCRNNWMPKAVPGWYYRYASRRALGEIEVQRLCRFAHLEHAMPRLAPRPLLMIHGGGDTYIKPEMAQELFQHAAEPKEFWLVPKAKHNQAFQLATDEYKQRVLAFFDKHLAPPSTPISTPAAAKPADPLLTPHLLTPDS